MTMLFHSIKLDHFLSFGETTTATPLRALNLVIGTNGSGKSNLLEAFDLTRPAPRPRAVPGNHPSRPELRGHPALS